MCILRFFFFLGWPFDIFNNNCFSQFVLILENKNCANLRYFAICVCVCVWVLRGRNVHRYSICLCYRELPLFFFFSHSFRIERLCVRVLVMYDSKIITVFAWLFFIFVLLGYCCIVYSNIYILFYFILCLFCFVCSFILQ